MENKVYKYNLPSVAERPVGTKEAIQITKKHFDIIEKFTKIAEDIVQGMLLTGSTAWGAYNAVTPSSDIDLLFIATDIEILKKVIERYIQAGLISSFEKDRFLKFEILTRKYPVSQFSIITHYQGVPVSLDFLTENSLEAICGLRPIGIVELKTDATVINVRTIKELRSNLPKTSGYSLDNLTKEEKIIYHPKFEIIKNNKEKILGYLSDTLIDGQTTEQDPPVYFLGVMAFFLAISPIILFDKNKKIQQSLDSIQKSIGCLLNNKLPEYITRQERMLPVILKKIKESLVKSIN